MNKLFYSLLFYCLSVSLSNERETDNSLLFERANESSMLIIEDRLPIADPYVLFYKDKYYAYGTRTNGFEVYISDDLEHWRRGDRLALSPQDSWGTKWYWAPEVYYIETEKKFYMFYTVDEHICVATSDSPEGPFVQDEKKPLREEKGIDASLFMDDDGKAYLYFVRFTGGNVIWGVEMNSDLKSVKEETLRECIKADAYRQSHPEKRDGKTGHRIEVSDKKVRIFAICKQTETGDRRNGKRQLGNFRPAKAFNQKRGNIRLRYRRKHKNEIFRLSPTVEEQTCQKKHEILHTVGNGEIHKQNARQKAVQKRYT